MAHPEEPTLPEDTGQRKNKNMEELMKMIVRRTALAVCTLVLALILPTAASAACTGFDDVPESADCYESVMYLAKCEIVAGMGNECFSPEQLITVEQWAVMLCRAYGVETIGDNWQDVGRSSVVEAYRQGWLNETALSAPRSPMCRSVLVESAFAAADVPVYDSTLYKGGASLSTADNILRVGRELGLCSDDADTNALVTRGEAAIILHAVLIHTIWYDCRSAVQVFHFNRLVSYILQFHLTYKCPQLLFGKRIIGHSGHNSLILRLFLNAKHILVNTHGLLSVRIGKSFIERTIHLQKSTIPHPAGMQICLMCRNKFHNRMILIL